jgi:hypothetical protein
MAFKTFAPGVLTSSDVNTFLMRQTIITCTSTTRPASPNEGMFIYETDTDNLAKYDGINWIYQGYYQSWTPVLSGSGWTFKGHTATGKYAMFGDMVHAVGTIAWDGTGARTAGAGAVLCTIPISSSVTQTITTISQMGNFAMLDDSLNLQYTGQCRVNSATALLFMPTTHLAANDTVNSLNDSLTSGYTGYSGKVPDDNLDTWRFSIWYEAA